MYNDHEVDTLLDDDNSSEGSADIVLNLLFFLLLTTIASGPIWEMINPPLRKGKIEEPPPSSMEYILIEVDSTNKITVSHYEGDRKKKVNIVKKESSIELYDALNDYYTELKKDSLDFSIRIRGDENASFGTILQAMAAAKDHNLEVSVQVKKADIERKKSANDHEKAKK